LAAETEAGRKSPGKDIRVAVLDLSASFKSDDEFSSAVSEIIRKELITLGPFTVPERDEVKKVFSQHEFHYRDTCYKDPACMSDIGHYIGVHRIIYGSIASVNNYFNIVLNLFNVPRGEISATVMGNIKGNNENADSGEVQTLIKNLMMKEGYSLAGFLPDRKDAGKPPADDDGSDAGIIFNAKNHKTKTPYSFENIPVGKHGIVVNKNEGYDGKEITFSSVVGQLATIPLSSKKEKVHISSYPEKAKVTIGGKEYGKTPLTTDLRVGSHLVEIVKNNYLTHKLIITVDSSSENRVEVKLEGKATVSVVTEPDYAHIYINGDFAGEGEVDDYPVKAGNVEIVIEAPEYRLYKTAEIIEQGKSKTIEKKLDYLFGSMDIKSRPASALLFLNDVETGTTPYTNTRLRTGKYKLMLIKKNYSDITEDVVIAPNSILQRKYSMKFSQAYKDSLRRQWWLAHGARGIRRLLFSTLGAVCGAASYYFEMKLQENKVKYPVWENEYDTATDPDAKRFKEIKEKYYEEYNKAKTNRSNRDLFLGFTGVCGAGFFISIFF
jgi:hypothetical protein